MKVYDYNDETKDVKGKVSLLACGARLTTLRADGTAERDQRAAEPTLRPEKRCVADNPSPGRGDADDRKEHLPPPAERQEEQPRILRDRHRAGGGGRPLMAPPSGHLRVLPLAHHQRGRRREEPQGLRDPAVRAGVPRALRLRGVR